MADTKQVSAVVVGVGPGLGAALARRFAQKYAVAIIARKADYLRSLAGEIKTAGGHVSRSLPILATAHKLKRRSHRFANGWARPKCCSITPAVVRGARSLTLRPNSMRTTGGSMLTALFLARRRLSPTRSRVGAALSCLPGQPPG